MKLYTCNLCEKRKNIKPELYAFPTRKGARSHVKAEHGYIINTVGKRDNAGKGVLAAYYTGKEVKM